MTLNEMESRGSLVISLFRNVRTPLLGKFGARHVSLLWVLVA